MSMSVPIKLPLGMVKDDATLWIRENGVAVICPALDLKNKNK